MALLPRPVTMMIWSQPAASASSTPYWMMGLSTSGSISLGCALVAGRKRVPRPAAGKTDFLTLVINRQSTIGNRQSQSRGVVAQHELPHLADGDVSVLHEVVVEVEERELLAYLLLVVLAQFHDLELAQGIDQVRRVAGAALGLALGDAAGLVALFHEELHALLVGHVAGVHLDADDVAGVAQQRVLQFSQAHLRIVVGDVLVEHHLLGVMRPRS